VGVREGAARERRERGVGEAWSIDATFIANALKSLCRRHTPKVTALRLLTLTTTRNSACTSPSRVRTTRNLGT